MFNKHLLKTRQILQFHKGRLEQAISTTAKKRTKTYRQILSDGLKLLTDVGVIL